METIKYTIDSTKSLDDALNDIMTICNSSTITISTGVYSLFMSFDAFETDKNFAFPELVVAAEPLYVGSIGENEIYVDPTLHFFDKTVTITNK